MSKNSNEIIKISIYPSDFDTIHFQLHHSNEKEKNNSSRILNESDDIN